MKIYHEFKLPALLIFIGVSTAAAGFANDNKYFNKIESISSPAAVATPLVIAANYEALPASHRMLMHIRDAQRLTLQQELRGAEGHLYHAITAAAALSYKKGDPVPLHRVTIFSVKGADEKLLPILHTGGTSLSQPMEIGQIVKKEAGSITHAEIKYLSGQWAKAEMLSSLSQLHQRAKDNSLKLSHFKPVMELLYQSEVTRIPSRQKAQDHLALARMLMLHEASSPTEMALAEARKHIQSMTQTPAAMMVSKDALREMMGEMQDFDKNTLSEGETLDLRIAEWMQKLS